MDEDRLATIKQRVDTLKTNQIRAQERLDHALTQLKEAYGYQTVQEAQEAYKRTQKEIPLLEAKLAKLLEHVETSLDTIEQAI